MVEAFGKVIVGVPEAVEGALAGDEIHQVGVAFHGDVAVTVSDVKASFSLHADAAVVGPAVVYVGDFGRRELIARPGSPESSAVTGNRREGAEGICRCEDADRPTVGDA